jgi:hypothetical protein
MLLSRFRQRRPYPRNRLRWSLTGLATFVLVNVLEVLLVYSALSRAPYEEGIVYSQEKIFIASIHWNNEKILREYWIPNLIALTAEIGPRNVFVSVYESGSWDGSKAALQMLDDVLANNSIPRSIVLDETTHLDEISRSPGAKDWVKTPRGKSELRRIPYLAKLRNIAMQPLYELENTGVVFDKVLFLNDVVFQVRPPLAMPYGVIAEFRKTSDIRELLSTRGGDYAAACALDFSQPPAFYDTFALRDSEGHEAVMQQWPYFRSRVSRKALKSGIPTPVTSCWNGIVAMDAAPFYQHPRLAFRGIADSLADLHVEGSECCLIHADNSFAREHGVWLNPNVRVGYNAHAYKAVNPENSNTWIPYLSIARGLWINRLRRWFTSSWLKGLVVRYRVHRWGRNHGNTSESGTSCLVNEMQVLVANGWAHV